MPFMFIPGKANQYHEEAMISPNDKSDNCKFPKEPCGRRTRSRRQRGCVSVTPGRRTFRLAPFQPAKSHFNHIVDQYACPAPVGVRCNGNRASDPGLWSIELSSRSA